MATTDHLPDVEALLRELLIRINNLSAEQARQGGILADILRALDRGRGARDAADLALKTTISEDVGDRDFTAGEIVARREVSQRMRDALIAADIDDAQQLGCVFRRFEGVADGGLRLVNTGDRRGGAVLWRIEVCAG